MQGFLWLLLQMALLLLAAAVVFFWLGWRWRGQKAGIQAKALNMSVDAESAAATSARHEKEAAQAALLLQTAAANREAAALLEAHEHQRHLEREILRLAEELKAARLAAAKSAVPEAPPPAPKAEPEPLTETLPAPPPEPATEPIPPVNTPAAKPSRHKKPITVPKSTAPAVDPRQILAALQDKVQAQQVLVGALNQEREGWEQRVHSLSVRSVADPAGFALASKNLVRSEKQHSDAISLLKNLQRQADALQRSMTVAPPSEEDDLTRIKGIKGALNHHLRAFGIRSYRQIALMSGEDLQAFSELLAFKNRANRDEWQRQARELHRAKYGADAV